MLQKSIYSDKYIYLTKKESAEYEEVRCIKSEQCLDRKKALEDLSKERQFANFKCRRLII